MRLTPLVLGAALCPARIEAHRCRRCRESRSPTRYHTGDAGAVGKLGMLLDAHCQEQGALACYRLAHALLTGRAVVPVIRPAPNEDRAALSPRSAIRRSCCAMVTADGAFNAKEPLPGRVGVSRLRIVRATRQNVSFNDACRMRGSRALRMRPKVLDDMFAPGLLKLG